MRIRPTNHHVPAVVHPTMKKALKKCASRVRRQNAKAQIEQELDAMHEADAIMEARQVMQTTDVWTREVQEAHVILRDEPEDLFREDTGGHHVRVNLEIKHGVARDAPLYVEDVRGGEMLRDPEGTWDRIEALEHQAWELGATQEWEDEERDLVWYMPEDSYAAQMASACLAEASRLRYSHLEPEFARVETR